MDSNPELLQSEYWARVKGRQGWRASRIPYGDNGREIFLGDSALVLERSLGPVNFAYCGHGFPLSPAGEAAEPSRLQRTAVELLLGGRKTLSRGSLFLRWDVPWSQLFWTPPRELPIRPSPVRVQPPDTVIIDLRPDPEMILSRMKSKTRYNIRLAEKRGVLVERAEPEELDSWYAMYRETALRDRISIHSFAYYRAVFSTADRMDAPESPDIALYLARHESDLLAGIVVSRWRGRATYLYGASSSVKRNLMANHLLQWRAMVDARAGGCTDYDLFGIPPAAEDETHPMHGLYRFKTGFGGTIIHRPGCFDIDRFGLAPLLFHGAERLRQWYHHSWRKRRR